MNTQRIGRIVGGFVTLLAAVGGCRRGDTAGVHRPAVITTVASLAAAPSTQPALVRFESPKLGIAIDYPGHWSTRASQDYELLILPPDASDTRSISLDVPELPFHIPGLIPIGSVQSGYVDDVKKQFGAVTVEQLTPPVLPKSSVRLVRCTGQSAGKPIVDTALLVVHSDRVYILRATTDTPGEAQVRVVFDSIVGSLRWMKS